MKKIDVLLIKQFFGPFVLTFFIALFVLIMQFLWKYIDDLIGKGLDTYLLLELIFYLSASVVPLALPIATLLSAIMTFGSLGEHYELVALKSAGISLMRFMLPLLICSLLISGVSFLFANYWLPVANRKFAALLYSVTKQRPTLNIKPGVFYEGIDGIVIKIGSKDPNDSTIYDIRINDHRNASSNSTLIAKSGAMYTQPNNRFLLFKLYNGVQYEEPNKNNPKNKKELIRTYFDKYEMTLDLSGFDFEKTDESLFKNNYRMLNVRQLYYLADSLQNKDKNRFSYIYKSVENNLLFYKNRQNEFWQKTTPQLANNNEYILNCLSLSPIEKTTVTKKTLNIIRSIKNTIQMNSKQSEADIGNIKKYMVEFYTKITLSLACLLLFLIGAPLGSIIRKGGLGLPMLFAILFFLIYHVISTIGKRIAEENVVPVFWGMWLSTFLILPLAIFLIFKAKNDSALFNLDAYTAIFKKIILFFKNKFSKT